MSARILGMTIGVWLCALGIATSAGAQATVGPTPSAVRGLLDGRAYEMVSPSQKSGAQITSPRGEGGLIEAAENGHAITYLATAPIEPNPPANATATQAFSERTPTGWSAKDISTPGELSIRVGAGLSYQSFSSDLSLALVEPHDDPLTFSEDTPSELSIETYSYDIKSGSYRPLVTTTNAPPLPPEVLAEQARINFAGASKDARHVVFSSVLALVPGALTTAPNLYEWTDGSLKLISLLPDESATGRGELGGGSERVPNNSVSNDGSHVIWSTFLEALYIRDTVTEKTTEVDATQGGSGSSGGGTLRAASSDDAHIFFSDEKQLTNDAGAGNNLYEFDSRTDSLTDLTPASADPGGAQVETVLGASNDGSYVYFRARGVLAQGAAAGESNLYLSHYDGTKWITSFIALLTEGSRREGEENVARVSPDGRFVAFMSNESLTGYDNRDLSSGLPDQEVYLYDAQSGRLTCASCNPSGERPAGEIVPLEPEIDSRPVWHNEPVAALIPPWTFRSVRTPIYQPRYLSDQGRLFFDSVDPLVTHDVNGQPDVYEYEPAGSGSCESPIGCISLVSSGLGAVESAFLDASANGDDAFFVTRDRLATQDFDSSFDLYDAHACSSSSQCVPSAPVASPPCDTGDGCKPAPTPQPGVFGDPASATFVGTGNPAPVASRPVGTKSKTKAKSKPKKRKAKKKSKKKKSKAKRSRIARGHKRAAEWSDRRMGR